MTFTFKTCFFVFLRLVCVYFCTFFSHCQLYATAERYEGYSIFWLETWFLCEKLETVMQMYAKYLTWIRICLEWNTVGSGCTCRPQVCTGMHPQKLMGIYNTPSLSSSVVCLCVYIWLSYRLLWHCRFQITGRFQFASSFLTASSCFSSAAALGICIPWFLDGV